MFILYDGIIVTMNRDREVLKGQAIVTDKRLIKEIGPKDEILKKYSDIPFEKINCKGKVILPGFVNTHIHCAQSIVRGACEDMGRAPSYTAQVPQGDDLSDEESYVFSLLGAATALRFGSTLISDNYAHSKANAEAFEKLGIRAVVSERVHDMVFYSLADGIYEKDDALGEELFEKNMELFELYPDKEGLITPCLGPHAPDTCSKELLIRIAEAADKLKVPVTTHLAQSRQELKRVAEVSGLSPAAFMKECGLLNDDLLAAHGVYLDDEGIELLAKAKAHIVHIPEGNAKAGSIADIRKMREAGLNISIATDNGAANMTENMRIALIVSRILRGSIGESKPEQILEMATINGAKALKMEGRIGSLEEGKLADIVIMNLDCLHMTPCTNVFGNIVHLGTGRDIETVMVDGKIVVKDGKVLNIDEEQVMKDARRIAEYKWLKADPGLNKKNMYVF